MKIIPAIDIVKGKCVRLTQGDYGRMKVYREDPLEVAKEFEDADLEYLHLVELDGARKGKVVNWKVIEDIQGNTALKVDFGGGVKSEAEVEHLLADHFRVHPGDLGPSLALNPRQRIRVESFHASSCRNSYQHHDEAHHRRLVPSLLGNAT